MRGGTQSVSRVKPVRVDRNGKAVIISREGDRAEWTEDYGPALKMPHTGHVQGKLWELRIDGRPNSYRVLYVGVPERKLIPLHIFAKKADKAPPQEIE